MKGIWIGFRKGMTMFGNLISGIVNAILLSFVYVLGVGITAIFAKLAGKRFLETELKKKSYWETLNLGKQKRQEYYRQF